MIKIIIVILLFTVIDRIIKIRYWCCRCYVCVYTQKKRIFLTKDSKIKRSVHFSNWIHWADKVSNWAMFKTETPIGCRLNETWWTIFSFGALIPKASFFLKVLAETFSPLPITLLTISINIHWLDSLEYFKSDSSMFPYNTLSTMKYQFLSDSVRENIWIVYQSALLKKGWLCYFINLENRQNSC